MDFTSYAPSVFRSIRIIHNISDHDFIKSICDKESLKSFSTNSRSKSKFLESKDNRYFIKTMSKDEKDSLLEILPDYIEHLKQEPKTFLPRIFGVYMVRSRNGETYVMVMKTVFSTNLEIPDKFDIKGSTVSRKAKENDPIKKDVDFLENVNIIHVGRGKKQEILDILRKDLLFLRNYNIMDYSMLVGICPVPIVNKTLWSKVKNIFKKAPRLEGDGIFYGSRTINEKRVKVYYFMGLIDILQSYNLNKKAEHRIKGLIYDKNAMSAVPTEDYWRRFFVFFGEHLD